MLCIKVTFNGETICTAGSVDWGIVSATVASGSHIGMPPRPGFELSVNGVLGDAVVDWATRQLFIAGDSVTITLVEGQPDSPTRTYSEAEFEMFAEAKSLVHARDMYAALKRRQEELETEFGDRLVSERDA
jgi:hypothetical protein